MNISQSHNIKSVERLQRIWSPTNFCLCLSADRALSHMGEKTVI